MWQAWPIYLKTKSVNATAQELAVSRQTVYRWLRRWFRDGSGDPGQDFLMVVAADGMAERWATGVPFRVKDTLRFFEFYFRLQDRAAALDPEEVAQALNKTESPKLSQVLEDATKKQRRSRKKSTVGL